ncbi:MAG: sulfite exporter TauE/SafE family protein [Acidobacteriaceae bacterium]|nr:sulfite exporter TauE/SafE family protein [Acidobacteriaceae bacterium]
MLVINTIGAIFLGVAVGTISGLVGIGGGAFLIPALVAFYGMSQLRAQGTSIAILLLPIGVLAFWKYQKAGHVDFRIALLVAVGFMLGGWIGGSVAQQLPPLVMRRTFAVLMMLLALRMGFSR